MNIRDYLAQPGHSQRELAAKLGVSQSTVSSYASGQRKPDAAMVAKIREATDGAVTAESWDALTPAERKPRAKRGAAAPATVAGADEDRAVVEECDAEDAKDAETDDDDACPYCGEAGCEDSCTAAIVAKGAPAKPRAARRAAAPKKPKRPPLCPHHVRGPCDRCQEETDAAAVKAGVAATMRVVERAATRARDALSAALHYLDRQRPSWEKCDDLSWRIDGLMAARESLKEGEAPLAAVLEMLQAPTIAEAKPAKPISKRRRADGHAEARA